jgi:Flp pilus assembly protein TadG
MGKARRLVRCLPLKRFAEARGGNIAVLFAIVSVPMLTFVGAAIDYTNASNVRTRLLAIQDAAVLSAVSALSYGLPAAQAQSDAKKYFDAQTAAAGIPATAVFSVTDGSTERTATSTFTSTVTTNFLKVTGFPTLTVSNTSTAKVPFAPYIDFYMLLDNTPSMGVAATPSDIAKMVANTGDQCAFACHDVSDSNNYYKLAKKLGVTLRIDVVRQATQQLTDTAKTAATLPNQFRMAVYTFGSSCTATGLTTISPLTSSLSSVKSASTNIDLMTIPYQGYYNDQCTDFDGVFGDVNSGIPAPGPGTAASPQKFVFFVSDGVADAYYPSSCSKATSGGRCQEPLKPSDCTALKARGVKIAVLYTTYLPLPTNGWYNQWIAPFNSQISTNMQSCASPGFYFEVSPTDGISDAMDALFKKAISTARLTQ